MNTSIVDLQIEKIIEYFKDKGYSFTKNQNINIKATYMYKKGDDFSFDITPHLNEEVIIAYYRIDYFFKENNRIDLYKKEVAYYKINSKNKIYKNEILSNEIKPTLLNQKIENKIEEYNQHILKAITPNSIRFIMD